MASPKEFAAQYGPLAASVGQQIGVDPSILLGQWGLETGWGKSVIPGTNNLGNIKDFSGRGTSATDNMTGSVDNYRTYETPDAFGQDFAGLLNRRYKNAIGSGNDAQAFAEALKAGGYAEDPDYVRKLVATTDLVRKSGGVMDSIAAAVMPSAQAAQPKQPTAWKDVIAKPEFQALSPEQQDAARDQYFNQVVAPRVPPEALETARSQFMQQYGRPVKPQVSDSSLVAIGAGLGKGVGDVALNAQRYLGKGINAVEDFFTQGDNGNAAGNWLVQDAEQGLKKISGELAPYKEVSPIAAGGGELAGNIAATWPVGSALGRGVSAIAPSLGRVAPQAEKLANALRSGGMNLGGAPAATTLGRVGNMATRMAGGAGTGAVTAGLINPEDVGTGAVIGGAFPLAAAGVGRASRYAGNAIGNMLAPFSEAGQTRVAANILAKAAENGPVRAGPQGYTPVVPGSVPTLAELSANPGVATLQRTVRDLNPAPFVAREEANAAARLRAFDEIAGDASKLDFFRADRAATAQNYYGQAIMNYDAANMTPWIKGQITQLLKRPSIDKASRIAQRWAIERGEKPSAEGSLAALHDVKTAVDDMIGQAVRDGKGGEAKALQATKDKLLTVMEKLSPDYERARLAYQEMSRPINQMETLQGLNLLDARGNITLANVQRAIRGLEKRMANPGVDAAKSLDANQLGVLHAIRDDLLRGTNTALGRSAGSSTAQNLATQNMLSQALPGRLGTLANAAPSGTLGALLGGGVGFITGGPIGAAAGGALGSSLGRTAMGALNMNNTAIQERLAQLLLNNTGRGTEVLNAASNGTLPALLRSWNPRQTQNRALSNALRQTLPIGAAKTAPVLSAQ